MESEQSDRKMLDYLEIIVLLAMPMPFLKLNIIYILLVLIVIVSSKYFRKENWCQYGFCSINRKYLIQALAIGLIFGLVDNYFLEPFLTKLFVGKEPDLSSLQETKGNWQKAAILLAVGWIVGGLFEELFFRGYLFYRIGRFIANEKVCKWSALVVTSIVFAFAHAYQDTSGMISAFYFSMVMGLLYYYFKRNVWYLILIHGIYDTFGVAMLYLGL